MSISLNIKFAFAAAALFLVCAAAAAWLTSREIEEILLDHLEQALRFESRQASSVIDNHLLERRTALVKKAEFITGDLDGSPVRAQRFLDESAGIKTMFAQCIYLFAHDGTFLTHIIHKHSARAVFMSKRQVEEGINIKEPLMASMRRFLFLFAVAVMSLFLSFWAQQSCQDALL